MPTPFKIRIYSAAEIESEYPRLWATIQNELPDLPQDQQAIACSITLGTCHWCCDSDSSCQCWNDE